MSATVVLVHGDDEVLVSTAVRERVADLVGGGDRSLMVAELSETAYQVGEEYEIAPLVDAAPDPAVPHLPAGGGGPGAGSVLPPLTPSAPFSAIWRTNWTPLIWCWCGRRVRRFRGWVRCPSACRRRWPPQAVR